MDGYALGLINRAQNDLVAAGTVIARLQRELSLVTDRHSELLLEIAEERNALKEAQAQIIALRIEAAQHQEIRRRALDILSRDDPSNMLLLPNVVAKIEQNVEKRIRDQAGG